MTTDWITRKEVAKMLGIKPESAKVWMWRMGVKRAKGNSRFTHRSWVEQAMKNGKRKSLSGTKDVPPLHVDLVDD